MEFFSTRNNKKIVSFKEAVLDCIPEDGGLYVPAKEVDLSPWILHLDEKSSFSSIAGSLTSALLNEEFSPVVCEAIANKAFQNYSPKLKQLEDNLYVLELFHGPTGSHKDFALQWLASALEHVLLMENKTAVVLAATTGITGRSLANAFSNKNRLKTILIFPKGNLKGIDNSVLAWNGGNIWPVEIEGNLEDAQKLIREIYSDRSLVKNFGLTLANTVNIGRLLPQVFSYIYAFSRLRKTVRGDIFYSLASGNYGNIVAGLYAWKFSLPVNGFITESSKYLSCNEQGQCICKNSQKPLSERLKTDPAIPSNIERLEQVFELYFSLLRGLIFPANVKKSNLNDLISEAKSKYSITLDKQTALAYGALKQQKEVFSDEGTVVLVAKDDPFFEYLNTEKQASKKITEKIEKMLFSVDGTKIIEPTKKNIVNILNKFI